MGYKLHRYNTQIVTLHFIKMQANAKTLLHSELYAAPMKNGTHGPTATRQHFKSLYLS